eukprot:m.180510 g.180510  ORF g.180510 m.180510 type:complete len:788 (+) comp32023_c1_seq1:116-2479(+)
MLKFTLVAVATVVACVNAGPSMLVNPCITDTPQAKQPWCNATLPIDVRVQDMISRMTLAEKIANLDTNNNAIPSLGLPNYNWWSEASTGVSNGPGNHTKFAFPITTGMSFNRTMWQLTGRQIGREARALMNAGEGFSTFWAPVINLAREPRWGRNLETPGEDPYQSGEYAEWFVKGMQEAPEDPFHIQASSCCKHFAANSMESTTDGDGETHTRHNYDANITMQDLVDSYLKPFQSCVEKGKVSSLMCSYNSINGVPSCANNWLLTTLARGEWDFDGYITSDCDAVADVVNSHHYHNDTPAEGVRDTLLAGTDVDCTSFAGRHAQEALTAGILTEADIDTRMAYLFRVRMRLDHFDPVGPLQSIPMSDLCSDYAIDLAQDGAAQGSTLLKNVGDALPLQKASVGTVAVIGPNANLSKSDAGYYGPHQVCNGNFWNMVDAVSQHADKVVTSLGVPNVLSEDTSGIAAAVAMAAAADTVVLVVGSDLTWSREGHDAINISFTDAQTQLMMQVAAAAKKPVIVVTLTATPLDISALLSNAKVGAIVHSGQPSVNTLGVGDVLFGVKAPAGRTVQTIYPSAYQDQISIFDFNMRPGPSPFARPDCHNTANPAACPRGVNPGRTHRFYTGEAVIPFGFGLSYTTFKYSVSSSVQSSVSLASVHTLLDTTEADGRLFPNLAASEGAGKSFVEYSINVTNTGKVDSDDVVLGFVTPPGAGVDGVPLQSLFGFERVHVKAGETVTVYLYPALTDFAVIDHDGRHQATAGEYTFKFGVKETFEHGQGYAEHSIVAY